MNEELLIALLNSLVDPIVFVDTRHVICYINNAAKEKYGKRGHMDLVGSSIFKYHTESSNKILMEIYESFQHGVDEKFLLVNKENKKVFMRSVRDKEGNLIGYYERYEKA